MPIAKSFRQRGASMVEMAVIISLFLALVLAVFEFALAVFFAVRLSDATREGARYAVVSNATPQFMGASGPKSCDELNGLGFQQCSLSSCGEILAKMNKIVTVDPSNVYIRYQCTSTGYADPSNEIYSITVKLQNVKYSLIMPGALHLPNSLSVITMPSFETTRLSEDLWSPAGT
jgi:hypothetical protein